MVPTFYCLSVSLVVQLRTETRVLLVFWQRSLNRGGPVVQRRRSTSLFHTKSVDVDGNSPGTELKV